MKHIEPITITTKLTFLLFLLLTCLGVKADIEAFSIEDPSGTKTLETIISSAEWVPHRTLNFNFGYSSSAFWLRLPDELFYNKLNIIDLQFPNLDHVTFYVVDAHGNVKDKQVSGDRIPYDMRATTTSEIIFLVDRVDPGDQIYIRIQTDGSVQASLRIVSEREYLADSHLPKILAFVYGMICITIAFQIVLYFAYRDVGYLYYVTMIASLGLFLATIYRSYQPYIFSGSPEFHHTMIPLFMASSFYFSILFMRHSFKFFQLRTFDKQFNLLLPVPIIIVITSLLTDYQTSIIISFIAIGLIASIILLYASSLIPHARNAGYHLTGILYFYAWLAFILGAVTQVGSELGYVESPLARHGLLFGCVVLIIILAIALSQTLMHEHILHLKMQKQLLKTQTQLFQAEKMKSVARYSSGLIHEIKNPLNWIKASLMYVQKRIDDEQLLLRLQRGLDGITNISRILDGLNWFAYSKPLDKNLTLNLKHCLSSSLNLAAGESEVVTIVNAVPDDIVITGSEVHLAQVFTNLLTNSLKALKGRKSPMIRISCHAVVRDQINMMCVKWEDNGIGMSEDTLKQVFEPFYTHNTIGEGLGLGTSIMLQIIQQHEGHIDVQSEVGQGTVFKIYLKSIAIQ